MLFCIFETFRSFSHIHIYNILKYYIFIIGTLIDVSEKVPMCGTRT